MFFSPESTDDEIEEKIVSVTVKDVVADIVK